MSNLLVAGNCYVSPYAIGVPITDYGYACAPHFYCPNAQASAQGPYEPEVCFPGSYCPDGKTISKCPVGNYCPTGTITPNKCPPLSSCPEGSVTPSYFGGLVFCGIIDLFLIVGYFVSKHHFTRPESRPPPPKIVEHLQRVVSVRNVGDVGGGGDASVWPDATDAEKGERDRLRQLSSAPTTQMGSSTATQINPLVPIEKGFPPNGSETDLAGFMSGFRSALDGKEDVFIDFEFQDLGLKLEDGKSILKGVNGMIRKTTFMSVLMGKVARTSGKLSINGHESEMSKYKKIIGYVPQEDIMLREMTVRENIYHSARVRLPRSWTHVQVSKFVDDVLEVLNLTHVQHNLIGSESERGISGGQRKRVNIGMELSGVPLAIFLDEPTSGLDSTSSLKVAEILRKISTLGLTIVAVVHQPRYEIFRQFNDLLMLVPGGKTAYIGPTAFVVEYYKVLGYFFDAQANPADILMDILSGQGINTKGDKITPDGLADRWETFGKAWVDAQLTHDAESLDRKLPSKSECDAAIQNLEQIAKKRGSSLLTQIGLCHNRYLIQQYRRAGSLAIEIGVASLAGALMGIAINNQNGQIFKGIVVDPYAELTPSTMEWLIPQLGLLIGMACSLAGAPAGVKVFAEEQTVFWREAANGHNKLGYFTGKALSSIYRFLLSSLHFASIFVFLGLPSASFGFIYVVIMLQFWSVYGMAMMVSMIVRREDSALLSVVVCLFSSVFCGCELKSHRNNQIDPPPSLYRWPHH
ncbi:hypothetical protein HDU98_005334 [Podochytrium sp. JEL0797]|nr:hypothetical protein HDU98_005334 [Podochytrium sp. JEL0797]